MLPQGISSPPLGRTQTWSSKASRGRGMAGRHQAGPGHESQDTQSDERLFHHAMRYEWVDRNPIKLVRQSAKRETVPDVLELQNSTTSEQAGRSGAHVGLLDAATGLRVSELLALRWRMLTSKTWNFV